MIEQIQEEDLWERLCHTHLPVVIYGMGDGAEKIMRVLAQYSIPIAAIFASDAYVRGHYFHGYLVERYRDIAARYEDFIVLLAFAVQDAPMLAYLEAMSREHTVLAPDVPVVGEGLFTRAFIKRHDRELDRAYALLMDEESRGAYLNVLHFKVSGKIQYLLNCQKKKEDVYRNWLRLEPGERIVDLGAYDGDTVREFAKATQGRYGHILAVEPDAKNYEKLLRKTAFLPRVDCLNLGAWEKADTLFFQKRAGRNSRLGEKGIPVRVDAVDRFAPGPVTLLKMDVEGSESAALRGAAQTIRRDRPKLYLCAYHRNEDLYRLPLQVAELCGDYRFYFCHHPYIPAWESNFYGVIPTT